MKEIKLSSGLGSNIANRQIIEANKEKTFRAYLNDGHTIDVKATQLTVMKTANDLAAIIYNTSVKRIKIL